jgi:cytochrome c
MMTNSTFRLGLTALSIWSATAAFAKDDLTQRYACVACHQPDHRLVGPSWNEVAARYRDGSKTPAQLAASIKLGGSGKWGPVPMPPQASLSDAELLELATWVLGQK